MGRISPPLSNAVIHILLALTQHDLHGYGIMQEIAAISGGDYKVGPGTLYDNLKALLAAGLVTESLEEAADGSEARRIYHLADSGAAFRRRFGAEMLHTFAEAYEDYGPWRLLRDGLGSLLRQRLLRRPEAELKTAAVSCGTAGLLSGVYPLVGAYEFLLIKLLLASLLTSILFQVIRPM